MSVRSRFFNSTKMTWTLLDQGHRNSSKPPNGPSASAPHPPTAVSSASTEPLAFAGTEIYGVIDDDFENSSIPDAIWHNLTLRREGYDEGLFSFYSVGEGTEFCLDTTRAAEDREVPVVAVYLSGRSTEEVAPDSGTAFLMLLEEAL
jgi:SMI1-KNR4 cell-wall